jgi:hypothetical protein
MVVVVAFIVLLATGGAAAGLIYYLTRPGVLPSGPGGTGPGPGGLFASGFSYPNTPEGLEKEASDLVAERRSGGDSKAREAVKLPEKWFLDAFGEMQGKDFYATYGAGPQTPEQMLQGQIDQALRFGVTKAEAKVLDPRFADPSNQKLAAAMKPNAATLYTAWLQNPQGTGFQAYVKDQPPASAPSGSSVGVQDFVYVDGAYRFFCPNLIWPR